MFYVIKENTVLFWICSRDCQSLSQVNKSFLLSKVNKMNCELMHTYDTPALRQTGSRNSC